MLFGTAPILFSDYAKFYATPQSNMLLIIHNLIYISIKLISVLFMNLHLPVCTDLLHGSGIKALNKII